MTEKLFGHFIVIPSRDRLQRIINDFEELTGLPNICGAIDKTHIPLAECPCMKITLAAIDFFNKKKFYSIVLQKVYNSKKIFWNVCTSQRGGVYDGGKFKVFNLYQNLRNWEILQDPLVVVGGMRCTSYLIANSTYPIRCYLIKKLESSK